MAEMRGFVFAITFIVVFSMLVISVPAGLLGAGETPDMVTPVDPTILTGFSDFENFTAVEFTNYQYAYTLGGRYWLAYSLGVALQIGAKVLWAGFLWLGAMDMVEFGERGDILTWAEIEEDADNGTITYPMVFSSSGNAAGSLVVYWNTTTYSDPADAWDNDELYLLHGIGIESTAATNALSLLLQLLFFNVPDVPILINIPLITPLWSAIVYVIWFVIKESMPFV